MTWTRVSKANHCPVCDHADWCTYSLELGLVCCMRVESKRPSRNQMGGWLHPIDAEKVEVKPTHRLPPPPSINCSRLIMQWAEETTLSALDALAASLGVSTDSLADLNAVWARQHRAWAFPMFDGYGNPIGIRLRAEDGRKWAVRGSRSGIFLPSSPPSSSVAYICEGPTDTAAALTLGLFAIGRPSCSAGGQDIRTTCRSLGIHRIVMVTDNDAAHVRPDGSPWNPGVEGAERVARETKLKHCFWIPPAKDLREFVRLGGTRDMIETTIRETLWQHAG